MLNLSNLVELVFFRNIPCLVILLSFLHAMFLVSLLQFWWDFDLSYLHGNSIELLFLVRFSFRLMHTLKFWYLKVLKQKIWQITIWHLLELPNTTINNKINPIFAMKRLWNKKLRGMIFFVNYRLFMKTNNSFMVI